MGKSKKRPRSTSSTTNDSPGKKDKPTLDPSEGATVEEGHSSLATKVKQEEEFLNKRIDEWIESRVNAEVILPPSDDEDHGEREDEDQINQLWVDSIMSNFRQQLSTLSEDEKRKSFKYECEWKKCVFMTGKDHRYFQHVEMHAEETEKDNNVFACSWDLCCFISNDKSIFNSHVHVHAYHTKLKVHGASLSMLANFPKCNYDSGTRNDISKIPLSYTCEWKSCGQKFDKIMEFNYHVAHHLYDKATPGKKSLPEPVACMWALCTFSLTKLAIGLRHLRKHTKQREVACFNCGTMFFERVMYRNHCFRQVDLRYRKFKCEECNKFFTTERLLNNHADIHSYHVSCPRCPRKFTAPSQMIMHLNRIHLKLRPMACTQCEYRTYTASELKKHMNRHSTVRMYRCDEFGCNATFRSESSLKLHIIKHYHLPPPHYACHLCEAGFGSGWLLSKHLNFTHEIKPKPGCSRYRYKIDTEDGFYKVEHYFDNKKQEQENREKAEKKAESSSDDDDDEGDNTAQHVAEGDNTAQHVKTSIKEIKMVGENEIAIDLGMEFKKGNTDQSDEQTTVAESVSVKKKIKSFKNKEKPGSAESKEDKKTNKSKKVQEFTVMKRYLKSD
ncbi:histone H4 transcription factor [Anopheles ziemanni]|uniref:histone H4 transcription factor n=1 Tax=Anopheles coustani TaxID=139045 RepID=UPI002658737E|nr:histone H4 transcription factor [Anopheles coustani]XP_058169039.1 histone H4 transcription factor [Anopheles ziemanni]